MAKWNNFEYDENKVNKYRNNVHEKMDVNASYGHTSCSFCGAVRPSGKGGVASDCMKLLLNMLNQYKKYCSGESKQELDELFFDYWQAKTQKARYFYIKNNTINGDMETPKKFRNQFKKEFFQSMLKAERISKKQLDIMERDIEFSWFSKEYGEALDVYMQDYNKMLKQWISNQLTETGEFALFAYINVCKAWKQELEVTNV